MAKKYQRKIIPPPHGRTPLKDSRIQYVNDQEGNPIIGLSWDSGNGYYYPTNYRQTKEWQDNKKRLNFGKDYGVAVFLFRQWEALQDTDKIITDAPPMVLLKKLFSDEDKKWFEDFDKEYGTTTEVPDDLTLQIPLDKTKQYEDVKKYEGFEAMLESTVPKTYIWKKARELILDDITEARKKLNLNIVIQDRPDYKSKIPLAPMLEWYWGEDVDQLADEYVSNSKSYWKEFLKYVKVTTLGGLTREHLINFNDHIFNRQKKEGRVKSWAYRRLTLVKQVFNIYPRTASKKDEKHIDQIYKWCETFFKISGKKKGKGKNKPKNMPPDVIQTVLEYLDNKQDLTFKAIWLLALNCGMRELELSKVKIKDINVKEKYLHNERPKTGCIRASMLWGRTLDAIKEMLDQREYESEYLFINIHGQPISDDAIYRRWVTIRKNTGLKDWQFEHVRDTTQSTILDADPSLLIESNLVMGHDIPGTPNDYYHRHPKATKRAVAILEKELFGKPSK